MLSCERAQGRLQACMGLLKECFGNNDVISQAWIAKILDRPKINNTQGLQTFADTLYIDTVRFNKRLILYMKEFYSFFFLGREVVY